MAEKIIVKKVVVGTPVKRVTAGSFAITNLGGVDVTASESDGSILAYNQLSGKYEVTNLRGDDNITAEFDSEQNKYTFGLTNTSFTGSIIPDSNEVYDLGSSSNKWRDLYLSGDTITLGSISLKDSGGQLVFVDSDGNKTGLGLNLVTNNVSILSLDSDTGAFTFNDSDIARTDVNEVFHAGLTVNGGATIDSATITNLANTNLTGSQATLDSANIGDLRVTGNTVLDGNLTISGTQTIINTETINLADNTIILNSNATGTPTENAGIEIERGDLANVSILWDEADKHWTLGSEDLVTTGKLLFGNVYDSEGALPSASQYHGMFAHVHSTGRGYFAHAGDWHRLIDSDTTARQQVYTLSSEVADITDGTITTLYNSNLTGGQATFDSASITTITNTTLVGSQATFDSSSITTITNTTLVGSQATFDSATITNIRFDNIDAQTTSTIRNIFSASGDLSYDSATGQFSFDVETVYTKANFDSDLGDANTGQLPEGTNLYYTTARADSDFDVRLATKTTDDVAEGTNLYYTQVRFDSAFGDKTTTDLTEGTNLYYTTGRFDASLATKTTADLTEHNSNLYYTTARADSDAKASLLVNDTGGDGSLTYDSATGVFTYTGPSASEVRAHLSATGDLSYDSSTGVFSVDIEDVYSQANFDSDFLTRLESQIDSAGITTLTSTTLTTTNATITNLTGSQATFDSANITNLQLPDNGVMRFGDEGDFLITHNGSHTVLKDGGTGNLYIEGSKIHLSSQNNGNPIFLTTGDNDAVKLFDSSGDIRLYTHSTGVNVVGALTFGSLTNTTSDISEGTNLYYTDTRARNAIGLSDVGGDGSLAYDSATGRFTYTGPSAAEVRAHLTANKGLSVTSGEFNIDSANVRGMFSASGSFLSYDSSTGVFSYTDSDRTASQIKGLFSATDAGGDGSFSYNSGTGAFTYTGPSASEVRAHFSGGTGVTYTSGTGEFAIGQAVGTTDNVTFAKTTLDSAVVDGINFNVLTSRHANTAGTVFFDSDHQKGLSVVMDTQNNPNPDVTLNVGQEIFLYVHNLTGSQIDNGAAVYISGTAHGKHPQVSLARANASVTGNPTGLATMDIPDGAHGWVTRYGLVRDVNTGGLTAGNTLYLSADSAGKWTQTEVTVDTGYPFHIGRVLTADSNNGVILVDGFSEHYEYLRIEDRLKVSGRLEADSAEVLIANFRTDTWTDVDIPNNIPWPRREGDLFYFSGPDALTYSNPDMNVKLGQDDVIRVYNNSGADIPKGKVVYVTGAANDFPTIALAKADAFDTVYNTLGLTGHAIANGAFGFVTIRGLYGGLDTVGFTVGDRVHVSADSAGELIATSPTFPDFAFEVGTVLIADSAGGGNVGGCIQVQLRSETFETLRTSSNGRIDGNLTVAGNLNILGTETKTQVATLAVGDQFISVQEGDTVTTVQATGTGLNDATFKDHYQGDSSETFFVEIYDAAAQDIIKWGVDSASGGPGVGAFTYLTFDSAGGPLTWNLNTDGKENIPLRDNITIDFAANTGHDSGDVWSGAVAPLNEDFGFFGNYNTGSQPFTHAGFFYDASASKFKLFDRFDNTISGNIDVAAGNFTLGELEADTFTGNLTGSVTGNADTATLLETSRTIGISGDVTGTATSFNGGADITISAAITAGSIVNADINAAAAIADSKLATISTAGKVNNSATTATAANTGSAIIARDASGNFAGGTFTGEVNRDAQTTVTAGTYGSATAIPVITIDANGFIDSAGTIGVSGITGVDFDSSNGTLTINTSGSDFSDVLTLDPFTTADLTENTNLYYTDARARASVSVNDAGGDGSLAYNNGTGVFTYTGPSASEVRAHLTANKGLSVSDGEFNIDSANVRGMFSGGTGITYNSGTGAITTTDGDIVHDNLSGFEANEHIDHTTVSVTAGAGLTGGGTIAATRTIDVVGGKGIIANANDIQIDSANVRGMFSAGGDLAYNSGTGAFSFTERTDGEVRGLISAGGDLSYNSSTGVMSFSETYSSAAELLTAVKTVDGASSGLDADLLDGQEGSHYRINVYNNAGTLLN